MKPADQITAELMGRVFGGVSNVPMDGAAFFELAKACAPNGTIISDEAWLAIPDSARLKLMSMYLMGVKEALQMVFPVTARAAVDPFNLDPATRFTVRNPTETER